MPFPAAREARALHAVSLRAALNAKPSFQCATPLTFIHPNDPHERTFGRYSSDLSMSVQLPLALWLSISARLAAVQPLASSAKACLRVRGSVDTEEAANAQPWPRTPSDAVSCGLCRRVTRRAFDRREYEPRPR
eukprot:4405484-Pleurochrysis_carterae.AAC.3